MLSDRSPTGDDRGDGRPRPDESGPSEQRREYAGAGVTAGVIVLLVVGVVLVALIAQNAEAVPFQLLWFEAEVSLAALLLAFAVGAVLISELVGLIWRRRRRTMRTLKESAPGS